MYKQRHRLNTFQVSVNDGSALRAPTVFFRESSCVQKTSRASRRWELICEAILALCAPTGCGLYWLDYFASSGETRLDEGDVDVVSAQLLSELAGKARRSHCVF